MDIKLHKQHQAVQGSHWWFRVKDNLLVDIAKKYFKKGGSVLDFGCNYGHSVKILDSLGFGASGVDISSEAINFGKSLGINGIYLESEKIFPPNSFDAVICLDVLEHIEDDRAAFLKMTQLVKRGGYVVIMVPAFMFMWGVQDVISHHFRRYDMPMLKKLVGTRDFEIVRRTYFNFFLFFPIVCVRMLAKIFPPKSRDSDLSINGPFLNSLFFHIFDLERKLLRYTNFLFGVSALLVLRKK